MLSAVLVTLGSSKTDQLGRGCSFLLSSSPQSAICPVGLLGSYVRVRPVVDGNLFVHFDGSAVSRQQFASVLRKAIGFLGEEGQYCTHSFRIGAATCAAAAGFSSEQIQLWGRWMSSCFQSYFRLPPLSALGYS